MTTNIFGSGGSAASLEAGMANGQRKDDEQEQTQKDPSQVLVEKGETFLGSPTEVAAPGTTSLSAGPPTGIPEGSFGTDPSGATAPLTSAGGAAAAGAGEGPEKSIWQSLLEALGGDDSTGGLERLQGKSGAAFLGQYATDPSVLAQMGVGAGSLGASAAGAASWAQDPAILQQLGLSLFGDSQSGANALLDPAVQRQLGLSLSGGADAAGGGLLGAAGDAAGAGVVGYGLTQALIAAGVDPRLASTLSASLAPLIANAGLGAVGGATGAGLGTAAGTAGATAAAGGGGISGATAAGLAATSPYLAFAPMIAAALLAVMHEIGPGDYAERRGKVAGQINSIVPQLFERMGMARSADELESVLRGNWAYEHDHPDGTYNAWENLSRIGFNPDELAFSGGYEIGEQAFPQINPQIRAYAEMLREMHANPDAYGGALQQVQQDAFNQYATRGGLGQHMTYRPDAEGNDTYFDISVSDPEFQSALAYYHGLGMPTVLAAQKAMSDVAAQRGPQAREAEQRAAQEWLSGLGTASA